MIELFGETYVVFSYKSNQILKHCKRCIPVYSKEMKSVWGRGKDTNMHTDVFITECGKLKCPSVARLIHDCGVSRGKNKPGKNLNA